MRDAWKTVARMPNRHRDGLVYVYAIGFVGGGVKIGRTICPRQRFRAWGRQIAWLHLFPAMQWHQASELESGSLRLARMKWQQRDGTKETFDGCCRKTDAVALVREARLWGEQLRRVADHPLCDLAGPDVRGEVVHLAAKEAA